MDIGKNVISSLKFIGQLKKGDKINTTLMYQEPDNIKTSFMRTFYTRENRQKTLSFVEQTINGTFEILKYYERSKTPSDSNMFGNIIEDLYQAKIGLNHLKETYSGDLKFNCDIDTLIQIIDANMTDINK